MNYEVNPRALKRVMAPADFYCPPSVNIELENENRRRSSENVKGELKQTWYFICIVV